MNPFPPALHVSAAYVALANRERGARILAALRSPSQQLALTRLWNETRQEIKQTGDTALRPFADAVFHIADNLRADSRGAARVVGITVKILTPPPDVAEGYLWSRPGCGTAWRQRLAAEIPDDHRTEAALHLAAVYVAPGAEGFAVVGADRTFTEYEDAATVSGLIGVIAATGLSTGLRAARSAVVKELPGAEQALDLAVRLSAAVEGL